MKKTVKILSIALVLVLTLVFSVGCESVLGSIFGTEVGESGDVTVLIEAQDGSITEYKVYLENIENKSEGAFGVLEYLAARENNPLTIDVSDSAYGKYINTIGGLNPDASANEYISVYTSVEKDFGTWDGVGVKTYGEITLKSAGVGVSTMSVVEGCILLFCIETY